LGLTEHFIKLKYYLFNVITYPLSLFIYCATCSGKSRKIPNSEIMLDMNYNLFSLVSF